jgi:hypothetical protein
MTMGLKKHALAALLFLLPVLLPAAASAQPPLITNTATVTANNGFTTTGDGTTTISNSVVPAPIPTLSTVGLGTLVVLLAGFALFRMRRQAHPRA